MPSKLVPYFLAVGALLCCLASVEAKAEEVVTASPYWEGFTGPDGNGLYHDLIRAVFEPRGYAVRHLEVPAKRGLVMVREGHADIYTCRPAAVDGLTLAAWPMYEGEYHALFRAGAFPSWDGVASLSNRRVVWRLGYYSPKDFPVPIEHSETASGSEALRRVIQGGADFYVDDRNLILETMREYLQPLDASEFRIEPVGYRQYFPVFSDSERGRLLRAIYEQGMQSLAREGKLRGIFKKWNKPVPRAFQ